MLFNMQIDKKNNFVKFPGSHMGLVFVPLLMCGCALTAKSSCKWFSAYLTLFTTISVIKQTS